MQADIRSANLALFPHIRPLYLFIHRSTHASKDVAGQLCPLILNHSMEQSGQRFDVREL